MKSVKRFAPVSNDRPRPMSRRNVLKWLGWSAAEMIAATTPIAARWPYVDHPGPLLDSTPPAANAPRVAIARADSYDQHLVRNQVQGLLDNLGGIGDIVRPGDSVAIKVNLTGGTHTLPMPIESYVTHPQLVRALGELLIDAGASHIYIVEGVVDLRTYADWGYLNAAQAINATLVDLNQPEPYADFSHVPVGDKWAIYRDFALNRLLSEVDAFISLAKMKCHWWGGVTLSMKNLVGIVPVQFYNSSPDDLNRSAFHGDESVTGRRLPQIVVDLNQARPVDLALIEGIKTIDGGEGPWQQVSPVNAGVLIAGKNAVATDAVATAVMGFTPDVEMPNAPFLRGLNHLNLAAARGLGTNHLDDICVAGEPIAAVQCQFRPCYPVEVF
jgi:uncharacterized protein (DUF362 family)